jgi:hypothetical protein
MIVYLVTQRGRGTTEYVNSWGETPNSRMRYLVYHDLRQMRQLERGTYLFTDHERLAPADLELARQLWRRLSDAGPPMRLVNDPSKVLGRLDLQRRLFDEGINRFRTVRANEPIETLESLRYPVFVREEKAHRGPLTPLLESSGDVSRVLRRLRVQGYYRKDLLVVEFCATADASGVIRKYAAFRVAGKVLPRHVLFSRDWNVKTTDLKDPYLEAEANEYLETNPHASEIARIFDLAGIEFGRIDYGMLDGRLQVWEINTNPTVRALTPRLTAGFEALDDVATRPGDRAIPWSISPELERALKMARRMRFLTEKHREFAANVRERLQRLSSGTGER